MATEIATMPLRPGIDTDDPNSAAGKVLNDTFSTLRAQEGYQRAYHGRQIENPSIFQLIVGMPDHTRNRPGLSIDRCPQHGIL